MWWIARCLLLVMWIAWVWPFIFRAPHGQKREHTTVAGPTRIGVLLEFLAFAVVGALPRPEPPPPWRCAAGTAIGAGAIILAWASVKHLGRQFRIHAGLYHDHELVRTGPYALVRHPIYASLFALLLANIAFLSNWRVALVAIAIYLVGTEIRVRTEDRLLASRFGANFEEYRRRVYAYIPFVR